LGQPRLILPLIWLRPDGLEADTEDQAVQRLREAQWVDVSELRRSDPGSREYRMHMEELAERLHETVVAVENAPPVAPLAPTSGADIDLPGLDDLVEAADVASTQVAEGLQGLTASLVRFGVDLGELEMPTPGDGALSPQAFRAWATRTAEAMAPNTAELQATVRAAQAGWTALDSAVNDLLRWAETLPPSHRSQGIDDFFRQIEALDAQIGVVLESAEIIELRDGTRAVSTLSRQLRPMAQAVDAVLTFLAEARTGTTAWLRMGGRGTRR
jgi:hypothetical protein